MHEPRRTVLFTRMCMCNVQPDLADKVLCINWLRKKWMSGQENKFY